MVWSSWLLSADLIRINRMFLNSIMRHVGLLLYQPHSYTGRTKNNKVCKLTSPVLTYLNGLEWPLLNQVTPRNLYRRVFTSWIYSQELDCFCLGSSQYQYFDQNICMQLALHYTISKLITFCLNVRYCIDQQYHVYNAKSSTTRKRHLEFNHFCDLVV